MGTDAEVILFDHDAYLRTVVPTFLEFLNDSQPVDWLAPFVKRRELEPGLWDKNDLADYLTALNPDFSWATDYDLNDTYSKNWEERWADFVDATYNKHSLERSPPSDDLVEQVNWLFQIAVSIKCVGAGQFVGRSRTTSDYSELISELEVRNDDRVVALLAALGKRGFLIGYQFGSGFEGVNGWLDPSETAELAERLDVLQLPRYETSFEAMEQFRTREWGGYEYPGFSFESLSLSFVRTVAAIAADERRGLLWGNNVMPPEYYSSLIARTDPRQ